MTTNEPPFFCDTTVVYYQLHSHSLLKKEVESRKSRGLRMSNYVRGEYIRGYVYGLVVLFSVIREEGNVQDGFAAFTADNGNRPRRIANALQSSMDFLQGHENSDDVDTTLTRLGEVIKRLLFYFDREFPNRVADPTNCDFGTVDFPNEAYSHDQIFEIFAELEDIRDEPKCRQCEFKAQQKEYLNGNSIDLYSQEQQEKYKSRKGYVKQAKAADEAVRSKLTGPSCWYCDRLGDTIIALSCPPDMTLLTSDAQSFVALCEILGKDVEIIPSLKNLREARDSSE